MKPNKNNKTMNKKNLISTLSIQTISRQQEKMQEYIKYRAEKIKGASLVSDTKGNIYITKGKIDNYPCVVSHMDTVHDIYEKFKIYENDGVMFSWDGDLRKQVGIGGDDKVGVFITLEALERFDTIKVAFFVDEELGCVGSRSADMTFFEDVGFVLQCDRKGYGDFVNKIQGTELYGDDFSKAIELTLIAYGYKEKDGGMTDVSQLKENGLSVACANMSCGYYNPHTSSEYIDVAEVSNVHDMVMELIGNLMGKKYAHEYTPSYIGYGCGYGGRGAYWGNSWSGSKFKGHSGGTGTKAKAIGKAKTKAKTKKGNLPSVSAKGLVVQGYYGIPLRNTYAYLSLQGGGALSLDSFETIVFKKLNIPSYFSSNIDYNEEFWQTSKYSEEVVTVTKRCYQRILAENPPKGATPSKLLVLTQNAVSSWISAEYSNYVQAYNEYNVVYCEYCGEYKPKNQVSRQASDIGTSVVCYDCQISILNDKPLAPL